MVVKPIDPIIKKPLSPEEEWKPPPTGVGWEWASATGWTFNGISVPSGPTTPGGEPEDTTYKAATDPALIAAGIYPPMEKGPLQLFRWPEQWGEMPESPWHRPVMPTPSPAISPISAPPSVQGYGTYEEARVEAQKTGGIVGYSAAVGYIVTPSPPPTGEFATGVEYEEPYKYTPEGVQLIQINQQLRNLGRSEVVGPPGMPGAISFEEYQRIIAEENAKAVQAQGLLDTAVAAVLPSYSVDSYLDLISQMEITEEMQTGADLDMKDAQEAIATANQLQVIFLDAIQTAGKTPETTLLLQATFPTATDPDINNLFGITPKMVYEEEIVADVSPYPAPFPFPENTEQRASNTEVFQLYRKQGGKLSFDQWMRAAALREAEITGELREDVFRKLSGFPISEQAKIQRLEFAVDHPIAAQFLAGWGDTIGTVGSAFTWLGYDELGKSFAELSKPLTATIPPPEMPELSWQSATDPQFWATLPQFLTRNLPFTLSLIPAMVVGYAGGSAVAGSIGLSALWQAVLGGIGGAALSRPLESVLEAGGTYDQALAMGMTEQQAEAAADSVFLNNLKLTGWDAAQLAAAFLPAPARIMANPFLKWTVRGGKVVVVGITEAGEEALQQAWQNQAVGLPVTLDENMKQAMLLGGIFGSGMGATGAAWDTIISRTVDSIPAGMRSEFDATVSEGIESGLTEQQALLVAVEEFSKTPQGEEAVQTVVKEILREDAEMQIAASKERQAQAIPEVTIPEGIPEVTPITPEVTLPVVELRPIEARPGEGYQIIVSDEVVGELDFRSTESLGVTGNMLVDIEVFPEMKRKGIATQALDQLMLISEEQKRPLYSGLLKPEGELWLKGLEERGVISLEQQDQKLLGYLISRPTPVTPAVAEVKPPVPPAVEVVPEVDVEVRRQLGELQKMQDIWSKKLADREQVKSDLAKFVRENLPVDVRGRFVTSVAKVKTDAQLQVQMSKVSQVAEQNAQKILKAEIHKELKKAQAKVKDHILKGKFTPEVQRRLDVLTHNLDMDRDVARSKMAENVMAYEEGKLSYDAMLNDNEMLNYAGIEGMSAQELANTLEYIKALEAKGKSDRQAKQEAATEKINATRTDIGNVLTGGQGLKTGVGAVPSGELVAKTGWWDAFTNWQYGIDNLADKLSKLDPTSKPYQSELSKFVAQVHRATFKQVSSTKVAFNRIKDIVGEVYGVKGTHDINQILNGLEEETNLGVFELTEEYKANHPQATTITLKMTRNQMIAKYMQMQDLTLNDTFTTGMGWSQGVKDAVTNSLTVEERKLGVAIFDFYEDYYTATNEIYQELFNVDMPHNPAYSPIRRDFESDIVENVLTMRDASQYASVLNGSLKARQRNIRPLKFNGALDILSNHIQQMEHFKAWATTMRDMRRVFGDKNIRRAVEQYHGRGVLKLIDTFLNQMARGGIETATTNRVADFLRRNFTKSILAIKPVIALKQIPSLFGYISEMNPVEFFGGIADYWTNPVANFKFLYNNSDMFRARMEQGFERDIRAAMQKHGVKQISGRGKITDWFLLQIRLGDTFAVTQGMWAKYKAGLKQGLTQEAAIAAAEDTTGRTQPSFGIDTLSAIQNGGSWLKLMTMFQNQPNKYFRMVGDNARNFKYGRGSRAKAASTILLAWVLLPMMFQFIADAFQWKPERQARAGILGPLNFILIGGQLVQSMWGWLTDQPFDYQISPVAQTGRDLQTIFQKAKKLINQGLDPYEDISGDDAASFIEFIAKAFGQVFGLPTPYFVQLSRLLRHKFEKGEEIQIKDFLFSEWSLIPPEKKAEEKVEDLNLLLGEPEEGAEDLPLTDKPLPIYTTADWFRDMGKIYDNVLPEDVLNDTKASKESRAWAEYEIAKSKANILPNTPLYKINTKDNADTIIHYYQQWKAREKITSLAELKEFDNLYPKAYLGNVTRQQYDLLVKYLETEDKDAFLETNPELRINPRDEWLKANPRDNALLALGGDAALLSMEAYTEFNKLLKDLDIPSDAIPELTLPPKGSVEAHFERIDAVNEFGANSWEDKLVRAKNPELNTWLELDTIDTPIAALELRVKHRDATDLEKQYSDKENPLYIEDADERQDKLREVLGEKKYQEWVDDYRRIAAIENDGAEHQEAWVERGKTIDEFGATSSEALVWLLDNPDVYDWAIEQELLEDRKAELLEREPVLRINDKWRTQDEEYNALPTEGDARELYLENNPEYRKDRRRRDAYGREGANGETFTKEQVELYVDYYELPAKGFRQERFLIENPEFAAAMHTVQGMDLPKAEETPTAGWDDTYEKWQADFDWLWGIRDYKSPHYIEDEEARKDARARILGEPGNLTEFGKAALRLSAYGLFVPEELIDSYVEYYDLPVAGYERERFLDENSSFYNDVWLNKDVLGNQEIDFDRVPSEEVEALYRIYLILPAGSARMGYRITHPELDAWLVLAKGYKPATGELTPEEQEKLSRDEELARRLEKLKQGDQDELDLFRGP